MLESFWDDCASRDRRVSFDSAPMLADNQVGRRRTSVLTSRRSCSSPRLLSRVADLLGGPRRSHKSGSSCLVSERPLRLTGRHWPPQSWTLRQPLLLIETVLVGSSYQVCSAERCLDVTFSLVSSKDQGLGSEPDRLLGSETSFLVSVCFKQHFLLDRLREALAGGWAHLAILLEAVRFDALVDLGPEGNSSLRLACWTGQTRWSLSWRRALALEKLRTASASACSEREPGVWWRSRHSFEDVLHLLHWAFGLLLARGRNTPASFFHRLNLD